MSKFGIMVKNNRSEARNRRAFTLVELIIAVTILAILATIAFLNLSGYTGDTRDSVIYRFKKYTKNNGLKSCRMKSLTNSR